MADELLEHVFHNPAPSKMDPTTLIPQQQQALTADAAATAVYAQDPYMHDPKLRRRLALVATPVRRSGEKATASPPFPTAARTPHRSETPASSSFPKPVTSPTSNNPNAFYTTSGSSPPKPATPPCRIASNQSPASNQGRPHSMGGARAARWARRARPPRL
jgi:hypothetical protein